jgi:hypothetical protein
MSKPGAFEAAVQAWGEHRAHNLVCRREGLDVFKLEPWIHAWAAEEITMSRLRGVIRQWVATGAVPERDWGERDA